jgi:hypothetical protein
LRTVTSEIAILILVAASLTAGYGIGMLFARPGQSTETVTSTGTSTWTQTLTVTETTTASTPTYPSFQPALVVVTSMRSTPPIAPAGPTYKTTIVNNAGPPVTNATLLFEGHTFHFGGVTSQNPLVPGSSTYANFTYIGPFPGRPTYQILVYGTYRDGEAFAFLESVTLT